MAQEVLAPSSVQVEDDTGTIIDPQVLNEFLGLTALSTDASDNLQIDVAASSGSVDVSSLPSLPAGTNNIGDVDVVSLPSLPSGANSIGTVGIDSPLDGSNNVNVAIQADNTSGGGDVGILDTSDTAIDPAIKGNQWLDIMNQGTIAGGNTGHQGSGDNATVYTVPAGTTAYLVSGVVADNGSGGNAPVVLEIRDDGGTSVGYLCLSYARANTESTWSGKPILLPAGYDVYLNNADAGAAGSCTVIEV